MWSVESRGTELIGVKRTVYTKTAILRTRSSLRKITFSRHYVASKEPETLLYNYPHNNVSLNDVKWGTGPHVLD
jgi:hypothetical protein